MNLQTWADNGWLRSHTTSDVEVGNLFAIVDRDLLDVGKDISADWRFGIAYNSALKLCTILLFASGFRAEKPLEHYRTLQSLPLILGEMYGKDALYLDACRKKRNIVEYDHAGGATDQDAEELIGFVMDLRETTRAWIAEQRPDLL